MIVESKHNIEKKLPFLGHIIFICGHAILHDAVLVGRAVSPSDRRLVGRSVRWSVRNIVVLPTVFCITAPAQPSATSPAVYPALFEGKLLKIKSATVLPKYVL